MLFASMSYLFDLISLETFPDQCVFVWKKNTIGSFVIYANFIINLIL